MYKTFTLTEAEAFEVEVSGIFPSFSSAEYLLKINSGQVSEYEWDIFHKKLFYVREVRKKEKSK